MEGKVRIDPGGAQVVWIDLRGGDGGRHGWGGGGGR